MYLDTCVAAIVRPTLTILFATVIGKQCGHSMANYFTAITAVKSVFSLIYRKSMIDSSSTRGILLVRIIIYI